MSTTLYQCPQFLSCPSPCFSLGTFPLPLCPCVLFPNLFSTSPTLVTHLLLKTSSPVLYFCCLCAFDIPLGRLFISHIWKRSFWVCSSPLTDFSQHDILQTHPCCNRLHGLLSFMTEQYSIMYMCHSFFMQSLFVCRN